MYDKTCHRVPFLSYFSVPFLSYFLQNFSRALIVEECKPSQMYILSLLPSGIQNSIDYWTPETTFKMVCIWTCIAQQCVNARKGRISQLSDWSSIKKYHLLNLCFIEGIQLWGHRSNLSLQHGSWTLSLKGLVSGQTPFTFKLIGYLLDYSFISSSHLFLADEKNKKQLECYTCSMYMYPRRQIRRGWGSPGDKFTGGGGEVSLHISYTLSTNCSLIAAPDLHCLRDSKFLAFIIPKYCCLETPQARSQDAAILLHH